MQRCLRLPAALLGLLVVLAACDTAEDEADFTATLTGAVDARFEGEATFGPTGGDQKSRGRSAMLRPHVGS
jgi:hypothetical protein